MERLSLEKSEVATICRLLLESVLEPKSAAYVAGPLDTGKIYFESLVAGSPSVEEIRKINEARLTSFARNLRRMLPFPVIDPGPLRIPGWRGADYGRLFLDVIDIFVREVWFIDGWEFSSGATKEFAYCVHRGIWCVDESGAEISIERGRKIVRGAIQYVESLGVSAEKLQSHIP
jgi:hypothetical protein